MTALESLALDLARDRARCASCERKASIPVAGVVFSAPYPFVREPYQPPDPEEAERLSWKPGVRNEFAQPDDFESVADGVGRILLTVVAAFKPGRFPTRVFFTRQWQDPEGRAFGRSGLHIVTAEKFRRLARGYQHEFRIADCVPPTKEIAR